jgi:hypothetical protein
LTTTHTPYAPHARHTEPCKDDARAPDCAALLYSHTTDVSQGGHTYSIDHTGHAQPTREPTRCLHSPTRRRKLVFRASATAECESAHVVHGGCDGCTASTIGITLVVYKLSDGACLWPKKKGVADGCVHVAAIRTCSAAALASGPRGASCASIRDSSHRRLSGRCWIVEFLLWCVLALSPILRQ